METSFDHNPVLMAEVIDTFSDLDVGTVVDCTVGGAGHACALLGAKPGIRLIGIDRDPAAMTAASERLAPFGERVTLLHGRFGQLRSLLDSVGLPRVEGVLADLGVSSHQLDTADRGFSFRQDGPLDMRMDPTAGHTAQELIAALPEAELASAIARYGEERFAKRVARRIVAERPQTTGALADLIRSVVPQGQGRIDAATRSFQGIRMLVNEELPELDNLLSSLPDCLCDGGLAAIITFHSLEDRAVKHGFRVASEACICPPSMAVCGCGRVPTLSVVTRRPICPGNQETQTNPRARSSKLRVARRLPRT